MTTNYLVNIWYVSFWIFSCHISIVASFQSKDQFFEVSILLFSLSYFCFYFYYFLKENNTYFLKDFFSSNFLGWNFNYFVPFFLIRKTLIAMKLPLLTTALVLPHLFSCIMCSFFFSWHSIIIVLFLLFDLKAIGVISFLSFVLT